MTSCHQQQCPTLWGYVFSDVSLFKTSVREQTFSQSSGSPPLHHFHLITFSAFFVQSRLHTSWLAECRRLWLSWFLCSWHRWSFSRSKELLWYIHSLFVQSLSDLNIFIVAT